VGQVTRLQAAGVRNLIVVGIMDISRTPYAQTLTPAQLSELQTLVSTFNSTLATGLAGKNVLYFDTSRLLNTILANPAAYGFTNTTTPACSPAALGCSPVGTQGYLFADPKHPSAAAHLVISDWIYSSLEAANRIGLLSQVAMARTEAQWRSIDARLQEFENFGYHGQGVFFSADYASQKYGSGALSSDDSGSNFVLGFEKALNDHLYGGVTVAHGHAPFDLGNNQGSVSYDEWSLSAFAAYKVGSFYANALASYARLDFASTRSIALGSTFHTLETGDTGGNRYAFKGQLGYNFVNGGIVHGPLAGLAWAHVDIDGFDENSSSITAMSFGDQTRESLRSRLGWQAAAETLWFGARVRPYAQLTYDYQYLKDDRSYRVGFVGGTSGLDIATANLTGGYGTVLAGLNAELSKTLRLSVVASTTIGQPGESVTAATVTLSAPF
jgi:outer membrane lipase/esterase